jgi:hypothetical protein
MVFPIFKHHNFFLLPLIALVVIALLCTKKDNPTAPEDKPVPKIPSITIISPSKDTIVESTSDTLSFKANILNSDYIDSFSINGIKIPLTYLSKDTLTYKLPVLKDTTKIIAAIFYQKGTALYDTVTIFKKAAVPTLNGLAKISGTLIQPSTSSLAKKLAKSRIALNAQGTPVEVSKIIPVSGADIMVYNAEALSTTSDTVVQTDSVGHWSVTMKPGNYFVFAVYFDRSNLEIITTSLPDIKAIKDVETKTDTSIALSDDINPMLLTFTDAAEANDKNMFIGSNIPSGLPVVMSFSEPMTRASIGDSIHGIILGTVNADSSELPLLDTIPVKKLWGPDGKELRLIPSRALTAGKTYKVCIPSSVKDLALNKLDNDYTGIFEVIATVALPPFAIKTTSPNNNDTIPSGFPVECIFSRPIDVLSLNKNYILTSSTDSSITGFFEVKGNSAKYFNKKPWMNGASYTLTINSAVKDLLGDSLGTTFKLAFTVQPKDTFEQKTGIDGAVASSVKMFMGAYVAGDIQAFSQSFHPSFELIESREDGTTTRLQLATFLDQIRSDIEQRNRLAKFGIIAPVYYYIETNGVRYITWKLTKGTTSVYFEDLGGEGIGKIPHVFSMEKADLTQSVQYINRGIIYNKDTLYFAPDMSKAFIDENSRENDPSNFGKLLKSSTNVETQEIMLSVKSDFILKNLNTTGSKDTAIAMIELIEEEKYLDGKRPFPIKDPAKLPPEIEKRVTALQAKMVLNNGRWLVIQIAVKPLFSGNKTEFKQDAIKDTSFVIQNFEQTRPIEFISPKQKSVAVAVPITLQWSLAKPDGIGGYIVVISNEMSGKNQGLLIFTRKNKLVLNADGSIDSGATILAVDPRTLTIPIPKFSSRLSSFAVNDSVVYTWKVIGIRDTTAGAISSGAQINIIADSDFGSHGGIGMFTLMDKMPDIAAQMVQMPPVQNNNMVDQFADRDNDMFPDWIEKAFGTSPDDPGSYPNFTLDTDLDGYADFLEQLSGTKTDDVSSTPLDINPKDNIPDTLQRRPEWRPELAKDDDKDGFPNQIEMIFGTDPWNAASKPSKSIKASVPVGKYFGGIRINGQNWKRINFSLLSDTTGNFVFVDTTELEGIARNGVDLSEKLLWSNGEWVYFLGIVNGPNTGKFIKVRFHRDGNNLRGPVDLTDTKNGGGQCVGEFFASMDSIKDFNNLNSPATNPVITNPNQQGAVNLGPPPADQIKRPDSGSIDMRLELLFADNSIPKVKVVLSDDSIISENLFWSPGQFPSLGFNLPQSPKQYRVEGNYHKITSPAGDTLVLMGIIEFNQTNPAGGNFRQAFNYVVFLSGVTDLRKPNGTWKGWYRKPTAATTTGQQGPNPYIGPKDSVDAALKRTSNTGVILETQQVVTISSAVQAPNMNIWTAKVDTSTYFIMEKMGDYLNIMIKDVGGKLCIALSTKGPGTVGPQNPPQPQNPVMKFFGGDSAAIIAALTLSENSVKVAAPNPFTIKVSPQSLRKEPFGQPVQYRWIISNAQKPEEKLTFLASDSTLTKLLIDQNMPVVNNVPMQPVNMAPFIGDTTIVRTALNASNNQVKFMDPNANPITINPATLSMMIDPQDPQKKGISVTAAGNPNDRFVFVADEQNPQALKMNGTFPVVFKPMN